MQAALHTKAPLITCPKFRKMEFETSVETQRSQHQQRLPRGPRPGSRPDRKAPTHFLAIRIVFESVVKSVLDVQSKLVQLDPNLQRDLIKSPKLHMTLCVMTLDTPDRIEEAKKRLQSSAEVLKRHYPANGPRLDFTALSHFRNRILFLEAAEDLERAKLKQFVRDLVSHFDGIATVENRDWTPHVTIYKPRTNRGRLPDSITSLLQTRCGMHEFLHVDLLRMAGKGVEGYYPCLASVPFGSNPPPAYVQGMQLRLAGSVAHAADDGSSSGEDVADE
jgi:2'-5' RNA ligase